MILTYFLPSLPVSITMPRRCRLRLADLWAFRCFLPACRRFSLPLALTRKRFKELLWVFIFGMVVPPNKNAPCKPPRDNEWHCRKRRKIAKAGLLIIWLPLAFAWIFPKAKRKPHLFRRQHGGHALAFHAWGFFHLGQVHQLFQDAGHDAPAFFNVLQLAALEDHVDQDLVLVLQEFSGLVDLGLDVMVAGLGSHPDFLEFLVVRFGLVFLFLFLQELELTEIHDLAHGRPLVGGYLDKIELGFPGHVQVLRGLNHSQLVPIGGNQADGTDADLLVDPLIVAAVALQHNTAVDC